MLSGGSLPLHCLSLLHLHSAMQWKSLPQSYLPYRHPQANHLNNS
nr:MAG TPA: hypothetical protein [Caudoviricetes sp.]